MDTNKKNVVVARTNSLSCDELLCVDVENIRKIPMNLNDPKSVNKEKIVSI